MTVQEKLKEYEERYGAMLRDLATVRADLSKLQYLYVEACREIHALKQSRK